MFMNRECSVIERIQTFTIRSGKTEAEIHVTQENAHFVDVVAAALGLKHLRQVPTGGDEFEAEREQWEDGNNLLVLEPGVVIA